MLRSWGREFRRRPQAHLIHSLSTSLCRDGVAALSESDRAAVARLVVEESLQRQCSLAPISAQLLLALRLQGAGVDSVVSRCLSASSLAPHAPPRVLVARAQFLGALALGVLAASDAKAAPAAESEVAHAEARVTGALADASASAVAATLTSVSTTACLNTESGPALARALLTLVSTLTSSAGDT